MPAASFLVAPIAIRSPTAFMLVLTPPRSPAASPSIHEPIKPTGNASTGVGVGTTSPPSFEPPSVGVGVGVTVAVGVGVGVAVAVGVGVGVAVAVGVGVGVAVAVGVGVGAVSSTVKLNTMPLLNVSMVMSSPPLV